MNYSFVVTGPPVAKARARKGPVGFYTPEKTKDAELLVQAAFLEKYRPEVDATSLFKVACRFYTRGRNRMDGDNLEKLIWDALTGVVWEDDSQIWSWRGDRGTDKLNPRTEVDISLVV